MKIRISILLIIAALSQNTPAVASPADSTFSDIVSVIAGNNPDLRLSQMNAASERASLATANNLSDPEVEFSHQWGQKGVGNKWSIGVSQSFEWPGVYGAWSRITRNAARYLDYAVDEKSRQVRFEIRQALIELIGSRQQLALSESMLQRIDSLSAVYQRGADLGEISRLDINKLKIELIAAERRVGEARLGVMTAIETVNRLNGGVSCGELLENLHDFPCQTLRPLTYYLDCALESNPTLLLGRSQIDTESLRLSAIRQSMFPGFSIGYSHDYEIGDHFNGFKLAVTIPVFSQRGKLTEARSRISALQTDLSAAEIGIRSQLVGEYQKIEQLDKEISSYQSVLNDSDNMRLLSLALHAGHITLMEYLLQANYFLEARSTLIDLQRQRAQAMSSIHQWLP